MRQNRDKKPSKKEMSPTKFCLTSKFGKLLRLLVVINLKKRRKKLKRNHLQIQSPRTQNLEVHLIEDRNLQPEERNEKRKRLSIRRKRKMRKKGKGRKKLLRENKKENKMKEGQKLNRKIELLNKRDKTMLMLKKLKDKKD